MSLQWQSENIKAEGWNFHLANFPLKMKIGGGCRWKCVCSVRFCNTLAMNPVRVMMLGFGRGRLLFILRFCAHLLARGHFPRTLSKCFYWADRIQSGIHAQRYTWLSWINWTGALRQDYTDEVTSACLNIPPFLQCSYMVMHVLYRWSMS